MKSFQAGLSSWAFLWALGAGGYPPPAHTLIPVKLVDSTSTPSLESRWAGGSVKTLLNYKY